MGTIELMEQAVGAAESLGYGIRHEYLGGVGGGACEIAGRKWIFVDLALSSFDQLGQVIEALRNDQGTFTLELSPTLSEVLGIQDQPRRSAA